MLDALLCFKSLSAFLALGHFETVRIGVSFIVGVELENSVASLAFQLLLGSIRGFLTSRLVAAMPKLAPLAGDIFPTKSTPTMCDEMSVSTVILLQEQRERIRIRSAITTPDKRTSMRAFSHH